MEHSDTGPTPVARIAAAAGALAVVLAVIVLAFSWPSVTAEPRDLPIGITGPDDAVAAVEERIGAAAPDAVAFQPYADRASAVRAIETREIYAAIVLGQRPELLTASAASPIVTQFVTVMGGQLERGLQAQAEAAAAGTGAPPPVVTMTITDVVPLSADDPRGTGFTAAMFPLVLGGMIGGIGISVAIIGSRRRVLAVGLYAVAGALVLVAVLQGWFGSLQGNWGVNAVAVALTIVAIAAPITGLVAVLGRPGIALGPVLFMLIGNPIAGTTLPPQFLPEPWGAVGQWFPPGASATLLRDVSYFPAADATVPWLVLALWAVVGLVLSVVGHVGKDRTVDRAALDTAAAPAT